jgi:hypothetical protein
VQPERFLLTVAPGWRLLWQQDQSVEDIPMRVLPLTFTLAAIAIALSACQTMTPEERRASDERQCTSYGFKRGTEGFATCLQRIDLNRDAQLRANSDYVMSDLSWSVGGPGPYYGNRYYYRHYR